MFLNEIFDDKKGKSSNDKNHKDVTKRVPELKAAAAKIASGEMSREEYQELVRKYKPVTPYDSLPIPASNDDMNRALSKNKVPKINREIKDGEPVGLRLDIDAYSDHGVWVPTIHGKIRDENGNSRNVTLSHRSTAIVNNPTFDFPDQSSLKIAQGASKTPIAKISGYWENATPDEAVAEAEDALHDPDWIQVGMDPERHGYFYDRSTEEPVVGGDRAIQIGGLVLVKNPVYGKREAFKYEESITMEAPLPPDWDKEVYTPNTSFKKRIEYAVARAQKLGKGSSRSAFVIDYEGRPTILKVAHNKKGMAQNEAEAQLLDDYYIKNMNIAIPLIDYDEDHQQPVWIHTEMAQKVTNSQLCNLLHCRRLYDLIAYANAIHKGPYKPTEEWMRIFGIPNQDDFDIFAEYASSLADLQSSFHININDFLTHKNWGLWQGEPVVIDLGLTDEVARKYYGIR